MKYVTVKQMALKWGISERRIINLCKEERIAGAFKNGMFWNIPEDASKPADKRSNMAKYQKTQKTILIAGINSQIGYELGNILKKEGHEVIGFYQKGKPIKNDKIKNIKVYEIDFYDMDHLVSVCKQMDTYIDGLVFFDKSFTDINQPKNKWEESDNINLLVPDILIREFVIKMNCDSSIVIVHKVNRDVAPVNCIQTLSQKYAKPYGIRINGILANWEPKKEIEQFPQKVLANTEEIAQDIMVMLTNLKNTTGTCITSEDGKFLLDDKGRTANLTAGNYYRVLDRIFAKAPKGSLIWAPSIMMEDEWTQDYAEIKFRQNNLDAVNRGVKMDRIFIFRKAELKKFQHNKTLTIYMQNATINTMYVDYDQIQHQNPSLLESVKNGFVGIDNSTLFVDLPCGGEYRGYVSVNQQEIKKAYQCFKELTTYAIPLKEVLKK